MPTTLDYTSDRPLDDNRSGLKWYQGLDRYCWVVLIIAALGWMFDTMDQNLMNLVRVPSLNELLFKDTPAKDLTIAQQAVVRQHSGYITSIFLLGWAAGGFIFGIIGDRLGRTRTMIITILIYAIFTGASGLVHSFGWYAVMRFITALGVGLWLSALNVQFRDVRHVVPFLTQLWMFATPIAYPSSLLPEKWRVLYALNPMVGVVEGFRWALLGTDTRPGPIILVSALASIALLVGGAFFFRRMERTFADVV